MDSNPNSQTSVNTQPVAPQVPQQEVTQLVSSEQSSSSNKLIWWIVGVVVLVLIAGGVYWYMNNQQKGAQTTVAKPTPIPQTMESLEKELNSASLDDLDAEFSSVDSDIQGL